MLKVFGYKTLFGVLVRSTSKFSRLATVIAVRTVTFTKLQSFIWSGVFLSQGEGTLVGF